MGVGGLTNQPSYAPILGLSFLLRYVKPASYEDSQQVSNPYCAERNCLSLGRRNARFCPIGKRQRRRIHINLFEREAKKAR